MKIKADQFSSTTQEEIEEILDLKARLTDLLTKLKMFPSTITDLKKYNQTFLKRCRINFTFLSIRHF
jgi:hypothetical protein